MPETLHAANRVTGQFPPVRHPINGHLGQLQKICELTDRVELRNSFRLSGIASWSLRFERVAKILIWMRALSTQHRLTPGFVRSDGKDLFWGKFIDINRF